MIDHSLPREKNLLNAPLLVAFLVDTAAYDKAPSLLKFKLSFAEVDFETLLPLFLINLSGIKLLAFMEKARFFLISLDYS